jgi:hypothetical protein
VRAARVYRWGYFPTRFTAISGLRLAGWRRVDFFFFFPGWPPREFRNATARRPLVGLARRGPPTDTHDPHRVRPAEVN